MSATEKGKAEGKQIGKIEGKEEVARDMLLDGMAVDKVAKLTKLSIEQIEVLAAESKQSK